MNRDERREFALICNGLIEENRKLMKQAITELHNTEIRGRQDTERIEHKLDAYCRQLYCNSFWGGIKHVAHVSYEWLRRKSNVMQKPALKKLEVKQSA